MTVNIGIDYTPGHWRVCSVEQERAAEFHTCATSGDVQALISQVSALYPEPTIVVSLDVTTPFRALPELTEEQVERLAQRYHPTPAHTEVRETLLALRSMSTHSYCAPSVEYLPTIPLHRRLMRPALGNANEVCAAMALLHNMRAQDAAWPEMNFFYINVGETGSCVLVIRDGQVVDGIGTLPGSSLLSAYGYLARLESADSDEPGEAQKREALRQALQEAFWEGLTQELAGLLAIHHIEDIVVLGQQSSSLAERLADLYQIYLFPHAQSESEGYEAALGAALLAEGLERDGCAAEVVDHLQIRQAGQFALFPDL